MREIYKRNISVERGKGIQNYVQSTATLADSGE